MRCPICHGTADLTWHGVPICAACREEQRIVDRRLNWILLGLALVIVACLYNIAR